MFNLISDSFDNYRTLLNHYGKVLGLDSKRIPRNWAATQFAEALGKAWAEYNNDRLTLICAVWIVLFRFTRKIQASVDIFLCFYRSPSAVVLMVVQPEERNMYDQYWLVNHLKESYPFFMFAFFYHSYHQSLGLKSFSKFLPMVCWLESGKN